MCVCVCVCACARTCVCVCVCSLSLYFPSPEVVDVQVKISGEHAVLVKNVNPHVIVVTETECGEKCLLEKCILSDTAFVNVCTHISYSSTS